MNPLVEAELKHLESIFKGKRLLSPADIAPLIGLSIGTMANQRVKGITLLPTRKDKKSGKVICHISVLAHYLVFGEAPPDYPTESKTTAKAAAPAANKALAPAPRKNKSGLTATKDWMLEMKAPLQAMQETLAFNVELLRLVERETLAKESGIDLSAKTRTTLPF